MGTRAHHADSEGAHSFTDRAPENNIGEFFCFSKSLNFITFSTHFIEKFRHII